MKFFLRARLVGSIVLALAFFLASPVLAQREYSYWTFGTGLGLAFDQVRGPVPAMNGSDAYEACTAVSDSAGNLLCYSNSVSVFDRNHELMPNGRAGLALNSSAAQGALLLRQPGSFRYYYLFTVGNAETGLVDGLRYTVIDMSLRGGLGDVVPSQKAVNVAPVGKVGEALTGIRHANGRDYWIVVRAWNTPDSRCYLFSPEGLAAQPVMSTLGLVHTGGLDNLYTSDETPAHFNSTGYLRASPDGRWLALTGGRLPVQLFEFNNRTGRVLRGQALSVPYSAAQPAGYGLEFSDDSSKLYATVNGTFSIYPYVLYQFNLTSYSPPVPLLTTQEILGALAKGPDGRIYLTSLCSPRLSVITRPNETGSACGLEVQTVAFGGTPRQGQCGIGLPNCPNAIAREVDLSTTVATMPNIITPNGDGLNQALVLAEPNPDEWSIAIYNRWGKEVHRQERYDNSWAAPGQPDGVYFYLLTRRSTGQTYKGWVEVLR